MLANCVEKDLPIIRIETNTEEFTMEKTHMAVINVRKNYVLNLFEGTHEKSPLKKLMFELCKKQ